MCVLRCITLYHKLNERSIKMSTYKVSIPTRNNTPEHCSFWLTADTMSYVRNANKLTRIPQGQLIQIALDFFRLMRKAEVTKLTDDEKNYLSYVNQISRILPL